PRAETDGGLSLTHKGRLFRLAVHAVLGRTDPKVSLTILQREICQVVIADMKPLGPQRGGVKTRPRLGYLHGKSFQPGSFHLQRHMVSLARDRPTILGPMDRRQESFPTQHRHPTLR